MQKNIVLTGNHLTPALALKFKLEQHHWLVNYLLLDSAKFNRHRPFISILSLIKLPFSFFKACVYLNSKKPAAVISFGGYSAFPVCLAAKILRLPLIIHEQTFGRGLTSILTAGLADKIAVSWPESLKYFPKHKTVLTGNPLRPEIIKLKTLNTKSSSLNTIYITGGHQGSLIINRTINQLLPQLLTQYQVFHQFGLTQTANLWQAQQKIKHKNYVVKRWFSAQELAKIYRSNPVVIGRSGINTITELAWFKLRAILIPLTTAQKNEQLTNARFLENLGQAIIINQPDLSAQYLYQQINLAFTVLPLPSKSRFDSDLVLTATDNLYKLILSLIK